MSDNPLIQIPNSVDNAIKNLTDKPTAILGETIASLFSIVFSKFNHKVSMIELEYQQKQREFQEKVIHSVNLIPNDNLKEPDFQTISQAIENSKYCLFAEELQEMFSNLISSSLNSDYDNKVHPSFAEIIKQMTPVDAQVLKIFKSDSIQAVVDYRFVQDSGFYCNYLTDVFITNIDRISREQSTFSLSSLVRLGLITISDNRLQFKNYYEKYTSDVNNISEIFLGDDGKNYRATAKPKSCSLTTLGQSFIDVCVR